MTAGILIVRGVYISIVERREGRVMCLFTGEFLDFLPAEINLYFHETDMKARF